MQVKRSCMLPKTGRSLYELSELSTSELVALAKAGDREAFGPLYQRMGPQLLACLVRRLDGDRAAADDLASETWVRALADIDGWRGLGGDLESDFRRWLFGIARCQVVKHLGGRWRETPIDPAQRSFENEVDRVVGQASSPDEPTDEPDKQAMLSALHGAIGTMTAFQQSVVRMRLDGQAPAEIARELGRTPKQVRDAWQSAQARLRRQLAGQVDVTNCSEKERARLREAARSLAPNMRQVALLRLAGLRPVEVAERLGLDRGAERDVWRRAQDLITRQINDPAAARAAAGRGVISAEQRDKLREVLPSLAPRTRRIAEMRLDGMRPNDIAHRLGCSPVTVRTGWSRARESFARQGFTLAA